MGAHSNVWLLSQKKTTEEIAQWLSALMCVGTCMCNTRDLCTYIWRAEAVIKSLNHSLHYSLKQGLWITSCAH